MTSDHPSPTTRPTSVFGTHARTDTAPSRHTESTYAFLRRVAGPVWDQCRALIDEWLAAYPADDRVALAARLRSSDDRVFTSAFWELYLYEMYRRDGWAIDIEPAVEGVATRPDFLVSKDSVSYYVEARCTFEREDRGAAARLQTVYDSLNGMDSGAFHLAVTPIGVGTQAPPTAKLRRALETWLSTLDPDAGDFSLSDERPERRFEWVWHDWHLLFRPMPRSANARMTPVRRALGAFIPDAASFVDDITPLRDALSEKGSKYGKLNHPLVIAINIGSGFHDDEDTEQALYGGVGWRINIDDPDAEATPVLTDPGYWGWPGRPAHDHVAGILLAGSMHYSRVARYAPTFWLHPYAAQAIAPLPNWRVARAAPEGMEYADPAVLPYQHFDLPAGWPVGEPFPRSSRGA